MSKALLFIAAVMVSAAIGFVTTDAAQAKTVFVDSAAGSDTNGCLTAGDACETINGAAGAISKSADGDTIQIAAGAYTHGAGVGVETFPISPIFGLTFQGPTTGTATLDAASAAGIRIFNLGGTIDVTINNLTIQNGNAPSDGGAGIMAQEIVNLTINDTIIKNNQSLTAGTGVGAGIHFTAVGTLAMNRVTVQSNTTSAADGAGLYIDHTSAIVNIDQSTFSGNTTAGGNGAAIYQANGALSLKRSTLTANNASTGTGGGLYYRASGASNIENSTFSKNIANTAPEVYHGDDTGTMTMTYSTMLANSTASAILNAAAPANPIVSDANILMNTGSGLNCSATNELSSSGYNIADDTSCGLAGTGDVQTATAVSTLATTLASNGGPTQTHALIEGSQAIDNSDPGCPAPSGDQRGITRPQRNSCDSGAFELEPAAVSPTPTPTVTPTTTLATTGSMKTALPLIVFTLGAVGATLLLRKKRA